MQRNFKLHSSSQYLIIRFITTQPVAWYEVTAISDRDEKGKLYGSELLLYEDTRISLETIRKQIKSFTEVDLDEFGLLYVKYRPEEMPSHGPGFGRKARIGITDDGKLATIEIDWNAPGAGTPYVDRHAALSGFEFEEIVSDT